MYRASKIGECLSLVGATLFLSALEDAIRKTN